jgi:hypothetical protein
MGKFGSEPRSEPDRTGPNTKLGSGSASGPERNRRSGLGFSKSHLFVERVRTVFKPEPLVLELEAIKHLSRFIKKKLQWYCYE